MKWMLVAKQCLKLGSIGAVENWFSWLIRALVSAIEPVTLLFTGGEASFELYFCDELFALHTGH